MQQIDDTTVSAAAAQVPAAPATPSAKAAKTDRRAFIGFSVLGLLMLLVILACAPGNGLILKIYNIPSRAMAPTLKLGSHILVSRASYGYSRFSFDWVSLPITGRFPLVAPQRGDVVVFKLPRDGRTDYVKRIIGLPGDKVQMIKGRLYINGQAIARTPIAKVKATDISDHLAEVATYRESLRDGEVHTIIEIAGDAGYFDNTPLFEVPQGQYFMMGDNRDNSVDSRMSPAQGGVGFVPLENLVGRVIFVF